MEIVTHPGRRRAGKKDVRGRSSSIKAVVCSTFVGQPVEMYVRFWGRQFGLELTMEFSPINTVFEEMLDPNSYFGRNRDGLNILMIRIEDLVSRKSGQELSRINAVGKVIDELSLAIEKREDCVPLIVGIVPSSPGRTASVLVQGLFADAVDRLNQACSQCDEAHFIDFGKWIERYRVSEVFDPVKDAEATVPFTDEFYAVIGTVLARKIRAISAASGFKVAVLDCDNTLWGGICGEDGWEEMRVSAPYLEVQQFFKQKRKEGLLLALCSKNREEDVWNVFEKSTDMILTRQDFVAWRINWNAKSENIQEIAEELKLGIDSFIFVDDDPVECAEMMTVRPEVLTLQMPKEVSQIPILLHHTWALDREKISREDGMRSEMYIAERKRGERRSQAVSLEEYRAELRLRVDMACMGEAEYRRAAQLTQRTTQFNLNGRVCDAGALKKICKKRNTRSWSIHAEDRFGEFGIVGIVVAEESNSTLELQVCLLSCRVLSHQIELCLLDGLKQHCIQKKVKTIKMRSVSTGRNQPFLEFLKKMTARGVARSREEVCLIEAKDIPPCPSYIDFRFTNQQKKGPEDAGERDVEHCTLHHIGIAVRSLGTVETILETIEYERGDQVSDGLLGADLALVGKHGHLTLELVKKVEENGAGRAAGVVDGGTAYHVCFEVDSIVNVVKFLVDEGVKYIGVEDPKPAKLFGNNRVGFFYVNGIGLIELLERGGSGPKERLEIASEASVLRIVTDDAENACKFLESIGYRQVKHHYGQEDSVSVITFYGIGKHRIQMVIPTSASSEASEFVVEESERLQIVSFVPSVEETRKWILGRWSEGICGTSLPAWEIVGRCGGGRELKYTEYLVFAEEEGKSCDEGLMKDCSFPVYNKKHLRHLCELVPLRFCSGKLLAGIADRTESEDDGGSREEEKAILAIEFDL